MNTSTHYLIDTSPIKLDVRILAALTGVICDYYQGLEVDAEEAALAATAADLAGRVDYFFQHLPVAAAASELCGVAGPLAASLQAACDASRQAAGEKDEDTIARLVTRAAWLQSQARDLAAHLLNAVAPNAIGGAA